VSDVVARRVRVSGRVQGVWFRESCRQVAAQYGVAGWVRNRADGRVEAWFEGPADAVDAVVAWCHEGPRRAQVTRVEAVLVPPTGMADFEVR
jgi:acylphosphatase